MDKLHIDPIKQSNFRVKYGPYIALKGAPPLEGQDWPRCLGFYQICLLVNMGSFSLTIFEKVKS